MIFPVNGSLLDACVLGILNKDDAYGYKLTQELKETVNISESTLYPVLRRLQKDGYLSTYDKPYDGRNRRYYRITQLGKEKNRENYTEWKQFEKNIERLLMGVEE